MDGGGEGGGGGLHLSRWERARTKEDVELGALEEQGQGLKREGEDDG